MKIEGADLTLLLQTLLLLQILVIGLLTIKAMLEIIKCLKDRQDIKVSIIGSYKVYPKSTPYGDIQLVVIKVANKGRRPITLKKACLLTPRKKHLMCASLFTTFKEVKLTEGESYEYSMREDEVKDKCGLTPDKYVAWISDSTGRRYYSHGILARLWRLYRIK